MHINYAWITNWTQNRVLLKSKRKKNETFVLLADTMSPFSLNSCALSCSIVRPDSLCKQFVLFAICKKIAINYCTLEMVFCMELAMCVSGCARIVRNYHHFAFRKPFLLKTKWHCKLSRLSFSFHFITFVSFHLFFFRVAAKWLFMKQLVYMCVYLNIKNDLMRDR